MENIKINELVRQFRLHKKLYLRHTTQEYRNIALQAARIVNKIIDGNGVSTIGFASNKECIICIDCN